LTRTPHYGPAAAAPSAPTREYIYSGGGLLAKVESGAVQYYHPDQLSVRVMTDSSGNVIGQQAHYPFGEQWYAQSTTTKWFFTDYERDSESGDDYASFRYNVNRLGRFASPDLVAAPATDPQSLDRYLYARNDPVSGTDPLGLHDCLTCTDGGSWWGYEDGGLGLGPAGPDQLDSYVNVDQFGVVDARTASAIVRSGAAQSVEFSDGFGVPVLDFFNLHFELPGFNDDFYLNDSFGEGGPSSFDFQFAVCETLGLCGPGGPGGGGKRRKPCSAKKSAFINANSNAASQVASQLNVPTANILGLAAEETGYGTSSIALSAHNFFGIHAGAPGSIGTYTTAGGATVSMFPASTGFLSSAQSFATNFGSLVNGVANPTAFAQALVPKFNTANAATGGNPNFVRLASGTIKGVSACLHQ
jgi:RHS repeat-associated protein